MPQPGFFDLDERYARRNERDPLVKLNPIIDWEAFREPLSVLRNLPRKSQAGRKSCDLVLMLKILVLQHLYNVSHAGAGLSCMQGQTRMPHSFVIPARRSRMPASVSPRLYSSFCRANMVARFCFSQASIFRTSAAGKRVLPSWTAASWRRSALSLTAESASTVFL